VRKDAECVRMQNAQGSNENHPEKDSSALTKKRLFFELSNRVKRKKCKDGIFEGDYVNKSHRDRFHILETHSIQFQCLPLR